MTYNIIYKERRPIDYISVKLSQKEFHCLHLALNFYVEAYNDGNREMEALKKEVNTIYLEGRMSL